MDTTHDPRQAVRDAAAIAYRGGDTPEIRARETTIHDRLDELDQIANQTRALADMLLQSITGYPVDSPARVVITGALERAGDLAEFTSGTRGILERAVELLGSNDATSCEWRG